MKRILGLLALAIGLAMPAAAATTALKGPALAITAATNATPIVLTTASNVLVANDWVVVTGVQGNVAANGVFQCSAVGATSCTLLGSVGSGVYTVGGTLQPLETAANTTGNWFDVSGADRVLVQVWSNAGSTATVTIEQSAQPVVVGGFDPIRAVGVTPAFVVATITNPAATGEYWSVPSTGYVRLRVSGWAAGAVYGTVEAYRGATRLW